MTPKRSEPIAWLVFTADEPPMLLDAFATAFEAASYIALSVEDPRSLRAVAVAPQRELDELHELVKRLQTKRS